MENNKVEFDDGSLSYQPKTVIFEGKEYKAPLDVSEYVYGNILLEFLQERSDDRNSGC